MTNINSKRETNFAVTLTPCQLRDHTYVARVPPRTVTTDQLLDLVSAHNQGIDRYQVSHAMELLKKEILEQAELGFAVDIMEICKLYVAPISAVKTLSPESESVSGFEARFTVNRELKKRLRGVTATVTAVVDSAPQLSQIVNPVNETEEGYLDATFSARIRGRKLKVGGEGSGVFFVPVTGDDEANPDETSWIKVPDDYITKNSPGQLEFHLPRTIEVGGEYFIAVRTAVRGNKELKSPVTGFSKIPVTIR